MRVLFLLLLFLPASAGAQNNLIDSLQQELSRAPTDSLKIDLHCQLSKQYNLKNSEKAWHHARQALVRARAAAIPWGQAKALNLMGQIYLVQGRYDQALAHHYQALKIGEQVGDTLILIATYNSLGVMTGKIKDPARSLRYYQLAFALARKTNNKNQMGNILNNLGDWHETQGRYPQALQYYRRAAALLQGSPTQRGYTVSLLNIGALYQHLPNPEKGLPYLFEAYRQDVKTQNIMTQVVTLGSIAKIFRVLGQQAKALEYARKSYDIAVETRSDKKISSAAFLLQEIYADRKDYQHAYQYQSIFAQHQDRLQIFNQQQVAAGATAKFEIDKKELENQNLKAEQARQAAEIKQQQVKQVFGAGALLLLLFVLLVVLQSRKRLQANTRALQQANTRMEAQHKEISRQRNEIATQAQVLQGQNEQLEKHHQFKNKIFSIISHDLRAPFSSIKGILDLVRSKTLPEEEVSHIFDLLGRDIDAATAMLNNLLGWSRAQLNGAQLHLQPVNVQQLAADNIALTAAQAALKGIRIHNEVPAHLLAFTDQERLNFVLRNLIMNAIKFTFAGGQVHLQAREKDGKAEITVRDNGRGIPAKNISRLFTEERFTTLGTKQEKGTGLGLRLSKEFIEALQGDITVESGEGQGSVFRISLPLAPARAQAGKEADLVLT